MPDTSASLLVAILALAVGACVLLLLIQQRRRLDALAATLAARSADEAALERRLRDEFVTARREAAEQSGGLRSEVLTAISGFGGNQAAQAQALSGLIAERLDGFARELAGLSQRVGAGLQQFQDDARAGREEFSRSLAQFREQLGQQFAQIAESNAQRMGELRATVEARLKDLQADNAAKLEAMRATVDEKLQATLETRLGESFKQVAERLEQVHRGLGEMATLTQGVGDLKRVLTNVKTRGTWGEVQLGNLLEQILVAEQYAANVATRKGSGERVEYAVRLPGQDAGESVWLPIDAKFPQEDYQRLLDAQERADVSGVDEAGRQLENRIKLEARSIRDKYIDPPHTTDFALLFLPTEGLYAEVIRRPGLGELLQREYRVTVAGPTTLTALLNSLQMGFRTLAIQKRSSEVWAVLGAVKTEFSKFGEVLDKVKKKLDEASTQIEHTGTRSRAIQRQLRNVESLPAEVARGVLPEALDEPGEAESD